MNKIAGQYYTVRIECALLYISDYSVLRRHSGIYIYWMRPNSSPQYIQVYKNIIQVYCTARVAVCTIPAAGVIQR